MNKLSDLIKKINQDIHRIDKEVERGNEPQKIKPSLKCLACFNNFSSYLPFGRRRMIMEEKGDLDREDYAVDGRTPRRFFADIDKFIQEAGISLEKIRDLQERSIHDCQPMWELYKLMVPVYARLLLEEYTHEELTA